MVCFDILLAYPIQNRNVMNVLQTRRLDLLRKQYNADIYELAEVNDTVYVRVIVCDESAVGFLRDVPPPIYCTQIRLLWNKKILYSFKKVTGESIVPPRDSLILKQVYWSASQLERRYQKDLL